jgi:hypothetical protein
MIEFKTTPPLLFFWDGTGITRRAYVLPISFDYSTFTIIKKYICP